MTNHSTTLTFRVGRLWCWHVRDYLKRAAFIDEGIHSWYESMGWIDRDFIVRGTPASLARIEKDLLAWAKEK